MAIKTRSGINIVVESGLRANKVNSSTERARKRREEQREAAVLAKAAIKARELKELREQRKQQLLEKKLSIAADAKRKKRIEAAMKDRVANTGKDRPLTLLRDTSTMIVGGENITTEICDELFELIASGETVSTACKIANVHYVSFVGKCRFNETLREALAYVRQEGMDARIAEADRALRSVLKVRNAPSIVNAAHNYAQHCRWVASRLNPKMFGDGALAANEDPKNATNSVSLNVTVDGKPLNFGSAESKGRTSKAK